MQNYHEMWGVTFTFIEPTPSFFGNAIGPTSSILVTVNFVVPQSLFHLVRFRAARALDAYLRLNILFIVVKVINRCINSLLLQWPHYCWMQNVWKH